MKIDKETLKKPAIIITVYDRCKHLKQCLESIEAAEGASEYHVIVGADAPACSGHEKKIEEVRAYLKLKEQQHGFKKLSVLYHHDNEGGFNNILKCQELSKECGHTTFIMMEDDVIVGNYFLNFMNEGLIKYESREEVIFVTGYLEPSLKINEDTSFLYNRFSAYGFAGWHDKWDLVNKNITSTNYAAKILNNRNAFCKQASLTLNAKSYPFLAENFYRAFDIEVGLMMEAENLWALVPPESLTANRGMDGSGLRSGTDMALQQMMPSNEKFEVLDYDSVERFRLEDLKDKIGLVYIISNWFSFIVYKYIPFGFSILKRIRTIKRSIG